MNMAKYVMALDAGTTSNRCIPVSYTHLAVICRTK